MEEYVNNCKIYKNKYGVYPIPADHKTETALYIVRGQVYEPKTLIFIQKNINNKAIITGGTYFGDFLPAISSFTDKKVYAFEPVPEHYHLAMKVIELNNLKNVVMFDKALSDKNTELFMRTTKYKNRKQKCGGCANITTDEKFHDLDIQTIIADEHIDDDISIIQLDVEKHENEALTGCMKIVKKNLPLLIVEDKPTQLYNTQLHKMGYVYHNKRIEHNYLLFIPGKHKPIF